MFISVTINQNVKSMTEESKTIYANSMHRCYRKTPKACGCDIVGGKSTYLDPNIRVLVQKTFDKTGK